MGMALWDLTLSLYSPTRAIRSVGMGILFVAGLSLARDYILQWSEVQVASARTINCRATQTKSAFADYSARRARSPMGGWLWKRTRTQAGGLASARFCPASLSMTERKARALPVVLIA